MSHKRKSRTSRPALTHEEKDRIVTSALRDDPDLALWKHQLESKETALLRRLEEADAAVRDMIAGYNLSGIILPPAEAFNRIAEKYREIIHFSWTKDEMSAVLASYMATAIIAKLR